MTDNILDSLFHGFAVAAFVDQARLDRGWPDTSATRSRAYRYYEEALANKHRNQPEIDKARPSGDTVQSINEALMTNAAPKIVILAGPNGAGKSTSAAKLLLGVLQVQEFVNADTIAQGLSAFAQERVAFQAGRIMLKRLKELAAQRTSFAFETTLASRSYIPWLKQQQATGYEVHLLFLWLPTADMAVARVADRVRLGGHDVPEPTIRRRYGAGMVNLREAYLSLANSWKVIDNTNSDQPRLLAAGVAGSRPKIYGEQIWQSIITT